MCQFGRKKKLLQKLPEPLTAYASISEVLQFTPPVYKSNSSGSYVEFYAFDPAKFTMRRKRIKLNHIDGVKIRKDYASGVIKRLNEQLNRGWNPWVKKNTSTLMATEDAFSRYNSYLDKMYSSGSFRKETYVGYKSYLKIFSEYARDIKPVVYLYQIDKTYLSEFLDHIFIDRDNCAQTRNNYLGFLKVFSSYLVDKGYLNSKPTDGIQPISKRLIQKTRTTIPPETLRKIADYCKREDPFFMLACYLLFYCFIRPVEMTRLHLSDIDVSTCTITIPADSSKNGKRQTVTMPKKVLMHALDLGVLSEPVSYFIFSDKLRPGKTQIDTKIFRDHWEKVRRALSLRREYKFYSLKDSGITEMLDNNMKAIAVRDQARHSSLSITEIYTSHRQHANKDIIDVEGSDRKSVV